MSRTESRHCLIGTFVFVGLLLGLCGVTTPQRPTRGNSPVPTPELNLADLLVAEEEAQNLDETPPSQVVEVGFKAALSANEDPDPFANATTPLPRRRTPTRSQDSQLPQPGAVPQEFQVAQEVVKFSEDVNPAPVAAPIPKLPPQPMVKFFSSAFQLRYHEFDKSFNDPLRELTLDNFPLGSGQAGTSKEMPGTITIQCCRELANLPRDFVSVGTSTKYLPQTNYQDCFALAVVRHAHPSKQSFFDHSRLADDLFKSLQLGHIDTNRGHEIGNDATTLLHTLRFHSISISQSNIGLVYRFEGEKHGLYTEISCLAAADFDADGFEDVLIMYSEWADEGSFMSLHPMVVTRKSAGGKLEVKHSDFLVSCLLALNNSQLVGPK